MRRKNLMAICLCTAMALTACGSSSDSETSTESSSSAESSEETEETEDTVETEEEETEEAEETEEETEVETEEETEEETEATSAPTTYSMYLAGNPSTISLAEIAEESDDGAKAWIKVATQFDSSLTVYDATSIPTGTIAVEVTFDVSDFDGEEATLYWCYQLISGGETTSIWDESSPTDTLTITEDGSYRMVFDANAALGGAIDTMESLQIVFPCDEETSTVVTLTEAKCITDEAELENYVTGKME